MAAVVFWVLGVIAAIAWLLIAVIMALRGDSMERADRVAQLYGYSVCLICVVVFLISVASLVDNAFKYSDPLHSNPYADSAGNLSSFDAYKATYTQADATATTISGTSHKAPPVSDAELKRRYDALRSDRIANSRFDSARSIAGSSVLLVIAVVLFGLHWRWLRSRAAQSSVEQNAVT